MEEMVRVLYQDYVVKRLDVIDRDDSILGMIDHVENVIYIKNNLTSEKGKVTLVHEILHAVFEQLGFDDEHDNKHLIKSLATGLYQVFQGNKKFLL